MSGSLFEDWERCWPHLDETWRWLAANKLKNPAIDRQLVNYLEECGATLHQRYQIADLLTWSNAAIDVCRAGGDARAEMTAVMMKGGALLQQDRIAEAAELLEGVIARIQSDPATTPSEMVSHLTCLAMLIGYQHTVSGSTPRYREAEGVLERAASMLAPQHADQVLILITLGGIRLEQGALDDAENVVQRALAIAQSNNAPHDRLIKCYTILASVATGRGNYQRAAEYMQQAAQLDGSALDQASRLHQTALVHDLEGNYELAETLFVQAFQLREQALGEDHLSTAETAAALAAIYQDTGRPEAAARLYERAYATYRETLGADHLDTAAILKNLGEFYDEQGQHERAAEALTSVLGIRESALGADHEEVATVLLSLGLVHVHQGQHEEAEPLYRRGLAIRLATLGPDDPQTATVQNRLANVYRTLKRYPEAEELYRQALAIREKTSGRDHKSTATVLRNMGVLFEQQSRHSEAEAYFQRALAIRENALGPDHADTLQVKSDLERLAS